MEVGAEKRIIEFLTQNGSFCYDRISTEILEDVSIRLTQLNDLVVVMKKQDKVTFEPPIRKWKPQPETVISLQKKSNPCFKLTPNKI